LAQSIAATPDDVSPTIAQTLALARDCASLADGLKLAEQALADASHGTPRDQAAAGHLLCFFLFRTGNINRAVHVGESILPLLKAEKLESAYLEALRWVGLCACDAGLFSTAIRHATEGCNLAEALSDERSQVLSLSLLGACFERSGDPWQGERLLRDALTLARKLGEIYPLVATLNNLSAILIGKFYLLRDSSEAAQAREALEASLPLAREVLDTVPQMNDPFFEAYAHGNLGELLVHSGDYSDAKHHLETALSLAESGRYQAVSTRVRCSMGELHLAQKKPDEASMVLQALLEASPELPPVATRLRIHYALYLAFSALGDPAAALTSLEAFRRLENQRSVEQLKARSELMVTRLEAEANQRKGLERAYNVAQIHASRAVELERMALQDELTGLGNRRALDSTLADVVVKAQASSTPLSVVVLDLDHFKRVNDRFGHAVGDQVLIRVSKLLCEHTRTDDLVTRTGGEEFVLVMPNVGRAAAFDVCERLRRRVFDYAWDTVAPDLQVTLSAGIACAPDYDAASLVERADLAMYRAKRTGRNRVAVAQ
jgi:diguanylate cyclase (GGDEF)-like protein